MLFLQHLVSHGSFCSRSALFFFCFFDQFSFADTVMQVGCGAGNTIFPLLATFPNIFIYACDFSPRAVDLVKVC